MFLHVVFKMLLFLNLAIFVCVVTKALILEVIISLFTASVIMTFKKYISQRGNPYFVYSYNATNFLGARNHLNSKSFKISLKIHYTLAISRNTLPKMRSNSSSFFPDRLFGEDPQRWLVSLKFSTVLTQIGVILNFRPISTVSNNPMAESSVSTFFNLGPLTAYPEKHISEFQTRLSFWRGCWNSRRL